MSALLQVNDVTIVYEPKGAAVVEAARNINFELRAGEFVGLVGESGSGKSTIGFAVTGLQKPPARVSQGQIIFDGVDIATLDHEALRQQRHGGFAMVLQSGMNALNPVRKIRDHFMDIFAAHGHVAPAAREARCKELMEKVKLPTTALDRYPGELSGGMRQRVSIALALSLEPRLMVFDEPTTALDVLVQHAVMETIQELQRTEGFTALLISHDLGIVLESTERVMVMHDGVIVEDAPSAEVLRSPKDPYTQMLLSHYADPRAEVVELPGLVVRGARTETDTAHGGSATEALAHESIVLSDVSKIYPAPRRGEQPVTAVDHVSFRLDPGEAVALVGQSGSGKSTIAKLITGVEKPTSGSVTFGGREIGAMKRGELKQLRTEVQMVFQDPYSALNPLHPVEYVLSRPVVNFGKLRGDAVTQRVHELLELVGLTPAEEYAQRLPHQLSGGQRQRVVIARALACNPQVLVADEPVSMLDVSLRAGVLALLEDLRSRLGLSLLYITHDLLSARVVTDRILVLHDGAVVEEGNTAEVLRHPTDDYTIRLLDSIPQPEKAHPVG